MKSSTCSTWKSFVLLSFMTPANVMAFRGILRNLQQQNTRFPMETHTYFPHGSDYITLVMSHVAALLRVIYGNYTLRQFYPVY